MVSAIMKISNNFPNQICRCDSLISQLISEQKKLFYSQSPCLWSWLTILYASTFIFKRNQCTKTSQGKPTPSTGKADDKACDISTWLNNTAFGGRQGMRREWGCHETSTRIQHLISHQLHPYLHTLLSSFFIVTRSRDFRECPVGAMKYKQAWIRESWYVCSTLRIFSSSCK